MSLFIHGMARLGGLAVEPANWRNVLLMAILLAYCISWLLSLARSLGAAFSRSKTASLALSQQENNTSEVIEASEQVLVESSPKPVQPPMAQDPVVICEPSICCDTDSPETPCGFEISSHKDSSDDSFWQDMSSPSDMLDLMCGLDEIWTSSDLCTGRPEAAVTADANSVLETALASGDSKLADAALAAGLRVCSSSWLAKACGRLQAVGIPLMPDRAIDIVRVFGQDRRADLALDLWEAQCAEQDDDDDDTSSPPLPEIYSAVLEVCARTGDFETAARAASSTGWAVPSCRHGQVAFLALARWYARRQDVSQALVCYRAVRAVSGHADLPTHRAVLVACVRSADMTKADMLFKDLVSSGITPDGTSFSAMICGHCSAGNVEKAMHYFRLLRERGIVPTATLFDAILDGCTWMNMPALMEQVLADMEATGVRPSTSTLSILVRLHGMNRDTEQALAVFDDLPRKHGLKLDGHAYGTLISVCLKNDNYDVAWSAFERMSKAECTAHARIYEALIRACLRRGHLDNAVQVTDEALGIAKVSLDELRSTRVVPRMRLQQKILEEMLRLIGRRRQTRRLGLPLLERLQAVGIELSDTLVNAVHSSACSTKEQPYSELHKRQALHQQWRNFPDVAGSVVLTMASYVSCDEDVILSMASDLG